MNSAYISGYCESLLDRDGLSLVVRRTREQPLRFGTDSLLNGTERSSVRR